MSSDIASMMGYNEQMKAAIAIASSVIDGSSKTVLVFGFPGNGKTLFPKALECRLREETKKKFSLKIIECDDIPVEVGDPNNTISVLNSIIDKALDDKPTILCFDEVDHLCPVIRDVQPNRGAFSAWMRRLLKDERIKKQSGVLLMGVTNNLGKIEPSVKRRFQIPLYFEPTPPEIINEMIQKNLINSDDLAKEYYHIFKKLHLHPMGAEVMAACNGVRDTYSNRNSLSPDNVVRSLVAHTPISPSEKEVERFQEVNSDLINLSLNYIIPNWLDIYQKNNVSEN